MSRTQPETRLRRTAALTVALLAAACSPAAKPQPFVGSSDVKAAEVPDATVALDSQDAAKPDADAIGPPDSGPPPDTSDAEDADAATAPGDVAFACPPPFPATGDPAQPCGWAPLPQMATPRAAFDAAWGAGKLYVVGGATAPYYTTDWNAKPPTFYGLTNKAETWDSQTDKWEALPDPPFWPADYDRVVWGGDRLYATQGPNVPYYLPSTFPGIPIAAFLPAQGTWQPLPEADSPGFHRVSAVVWTGKQLFVWGDASAPTANPGATYDPVKNQWTPLPEAPVSEKKFQTACYGWTGKFVMMYDHYHSQSGLIYEPGTGSWSTFPVGPMFSHDNCATFAGGLFVLAGNTVESTPDKNAAYLRWLDGGWEAIPRPSWLQAVQGAAVAAIGSRILVWGGGGGGAIYNVGGIFDPATKTWQVLPALGAPGARGAMAVVHDEELFVIGGFGSVPGATFAWDDGGRLLIGK